MTGAYSINGGISRLERDALHSLQSAKSKRLYEHMRDGEYSIDRECLIFDVQGLRNSFHTIG